MTRSLDPIQVAVTPDAYRFTKLDNILTCHVYTKARSWPPGKVSDNINPRSHGEDVLDSPVAQAIRKTLEEDPKNFVLMNRGILLLADSIEFSRDRLYVTFDGDSRLRGLADGGTTDAVISSVKDIPDAASIHIEIIVGLNDPDRVAGLVEGRNTSRQVRQSSLVNAAGHFDWLKEALPASIRDRI